MKIKLLLGTLLLTLGLSTSAVAENYVIDKKGQHAVIQFKIAHLGYSWLIGRFNDFDGTFSYDEKNPSAAKINVTINTASVDSNHAARDKHLRNADFFNVEKYPTSTFVSKSFISKSARLFAVGRLKCRRSRTRCSPRCMASSTHPILSAAG